MTAPFQNNAFQNNAIQIIERLNSPFQDSVFQNNAFEQLNLLPVPSYNVLIEFTANSYTNVTTECLRFSINRDIASYEKGLSVGRCDMIFDNHERKYSPLNSGSPYSGFLNPNKQILIQATYITSTYTLFTGNIDSFTIDPKLGNRTVHVQASDLLKNIDLQTINMPLKTNINVGSLFTDVLTHALVPETSRHVHPFKDILQFAWLRDRQPTGIINDLLTYGNYGSYISGEGLFHVHDRYFNMESTCVASYNEFLDLSYSRDESDMGNIIRVTGHPKAQSTNINTIAFITDVIEIPALGYNSFWLEYIDPDTLETRTPATSVFTSINSDYTANSDKTGIGTDLTSYINVNPAFFADTSIISFYNSHPTLTAWLTKFQLRGYSIQTKPSLSHVIEVSSSQLAYGKRDYTIESDFISTLSYTKDYAKFLVVDHKDPSDNVTITLKNIWPDILQRELSDIIHIVESNTSLNNNVTIMSLSHEISFERGLEHIVTYSSEIYEQIAWIVLNDPVKGILQSTGRTVGF